jgi:uncharacterized protein (TIGR02284 family)
MADTTDALFELVQTLEDSVAGLRDAADRLVSTTHPEIAGTFLVSARQREAYIAELRALTKHAGDLPDEGTLAGLIHRKWMGLKDVMSGTEPDGVLDAVQQGEDEALRIYQKALGVELPDVLRSAIERQRDEVAATVAEVHSLRRSVE